MKIIIFLKKILPVFGSSVTGILMAFVEMKSHKLRSLLSMLGVMLGIASLVAMLTMIGGIEKFLNEKMGMWMGSVWYWEKQDPSQDQKLLWSRSPGLKLSDGQYLKQNSKYVKDIPQIITRYGNIHSPKRNETSILKGIDSSSLELEKEEIKIKYGRWISNDEYNQGLLNCVISWHIAGILKQDYRLKDTSDVILKKLKFNNIEFSVIGIFEPINRSNDSWRIQRSIITALKTVQKHISGFDPNPGNLHVQVKNPRQLKEQAKLIAILLSQKHRGVQDFEYQTADWANKVTSMLNNISMIMAFISILSLSVGGLSIMNVMLSSISERVKEIGIRKALGAKNLQILIQFVAESATLSFVGGIFGIFLGCIPILFKEQIARSTEGAIEPVFLTSHIIATFSIILAVGILFGLYPAIKACGMNPVNALKYE